MDVEVIGMETLERLQRLKVHEMSLARYLEKWKIELFYREIELSTKILLKTVPY